MMAGCIGSEFYLSSSKLGVRGPRPGKRPAGAPSGVYTDSAGLRLVRPNTVRKIEHRTTGSSPDIAAGATWPMPGPVAAIQNPSDTSWMVFGWWWLRASVTAMGTGTIDLRAEPSLVWDASGPVVWRFATDLAASGPDAGQVRAVDVAWPVCEVIAAKTTALFRLNPKVINKTNAPIRVTGFDVRFDGLRTATSAVPERTVGAVIQANAGKTIDQFAAQYSGNTLDQVAAELA
jgi:hypothetical protein